MVASWQHLVQAATARGRHGGVAVAVELPSLSVAEVRDSRIESTQVTSFCCSEEHCFSQAEDSTSVATATPPPSPFTGSVNENMMFVLQVARICEVVGRPKVENMQTAGRLIQLSYLLRAFTFAWRSSRPAHRPIIASDPSLGGHRRGSFVIS